MPQSTPVCVTGATGFIGGHIVDQLLGKGYTVHGTVRDPDAPKNAFLKDIAKNNEAAGGKLVLFKADLSETGSFDKAIEGCEVVVHVAAVVTTNYKKDPFAEVINPTLDGVRNVVDSCNRLGVKRIVYTSSTATILVPEKIRKELKGTPFTEDVWATHFTPTYGTYNYSKIEAEKLLNELWKGPLVSILPSLVLGPQQNERVTSSMQFVKALANKEFPLCPPYYYDCVDVRDVAGAHVYAVEHPEMPTGRYNATGNNNYSTGELATFMNAAIPKLNVPTRMMPWGVMWLVSWYDSRISSHHLYERAVKYSPVSNERVQKAGYVYKHTDIKTTLRDCYESFVKFGVSKGV